MVNDEKLENVPEFCHLGNMLSAGVGCELAASLGQVQPTASSSHQPQPAASDPR